MCAYYIIYYISFFVYNEGSSKSCLSSLSIKFFLKSIRPSFLIKLAALGNLKVNFHCAHWHSFFPLKKGLSKTHQSSLSLKFFLKSPRPSLPLKRAPPLSPSPFSHGEGWLHSAI